jgi:hypothetical protein
MIYMSSSQLLGISILRIPLIFNYSLPFCLSPTQPNSKFGLTKYLLGPHPTTSGTFKTLPDNPGSRFSVCNLSWTQLTRRPKKMEDELKKIEYNGRRPHTNKNLNGRRPKKNENGRRAQFIYF